MKSKKLKFVALGVAAMLCSLVWLPAGGASTYGQGYNNNIYWITPF